VSRRPLLLALAAAFATFAVGRAVADDLDVPKLFDSAKAAFGEKKYGKALRDTQDALAEIARLRAEAVKAALPGAPEGWKAEDAEGDLQGFAWLAQGIDLKRRYTRGDETSAQLDLWVDAPIVVQSLSMAIANPAFVPGGKIVTIKGRRALYEYSKENKTAKLTIQLQTPNSILVLEGRGLGDKELSDSFASSLDLDALEKSIAN